MESFWAVGPRAYLPFEDPWAVPYQVSLEPSCVDVPLVVPYQISEVPSYEEVTLEEVPRQEVPQGLQMGVFLVEVPYFQAWKGVVQAKY